MVSPGTSGSLGVNKNLNILYVEVVEISAKVNDGYYNTGDIVPIAVKFNQNVSVSGTPQLTLETGSTDAVIDYNSGSGTSELTFNYTVAESHSSDDLTAPQSNQHKYTAYPHHI